MNNKQLLQAMALDLKRVALGSYSGSQKMNNRFLQEVANRKDSPQYDTLPDIVQRQLQKNDQALDRNSQTLHEDALMYSTILLSLANRTM